MDLTLSLSPLTALQFVDVESRYEQNSIHFLVQLESHVIYY